MRCKSPCMQNVENIVAFTRELGITKNVSKRTCVTEKFHVLSSDLYWIRTNVIDTHSMVNQKFTN